MLVVVRPSAVGEVQRVFARYELEAAAIGEVTDGALIRCRSAGDVVCEVAGRALADEAPRYEIHGIGPSPEPIDLEPLAAEPVSASVLLELLGSANARDRKPIWQRYDHMNGTNTLVGPGAGDAALLRLKGTRTGPRAGDRRTRSRAPRRARSLPGRRLGGPGGRPERRVLGRDPDRDHRLPEFRVPRDRHRSLAAGASDRRDRRCLPDPRPAGGLGERQPLQRDAGRSDPRDARRRHGRSPRGARSGDPDGVARRRRALADRRPRGRQRRPGCVRAGLASRPPRGAAIARRRGREPARPAAAAPRRGSRRGRRA